MRDQSCIIGQLTLVLVMKMVNYLLMCTMLVRFCAHLSLSQVAVEAKRGVSNLEKLVDEFQQEEDAKERRRELKRLKKKQKRASKAQSQAMPASCLSAATNKEQEETVLDESVSSTEYRAMCGSCSVSYAASASSCSDVEQAEEDILCGCCPCDSVPLRLVSNCGLPSGEPEKSNLVDGWLKDQSHNDCIEDEEQQQILQDEFLECHQHQDMAGFVSQLGLNTLVKHACLLVSCKCMYCLL